MRVVVLAILLAAGLQLDAAKAAVFHWEGNCTLGCAGTATADLTLSAGTPLKFSLTDFVSFQYSSSSGSFSLDNTSPYLYAQAGAPLVTNGILLEENGQGPNTLPLFQFSFFLPANPSLTLSPEQGAWQFLSGWTAPLE
jgi:hypothetical protein